MATLEEIRRESRSAGSSSSSRSSSTCTARPSAKLVPAANLDDLVADGAGFAGFAAGEIGQVPSDPDIAAMPDLDSFTPGSRGSRTSRASPATSPSRASRGRTARGRSCATSLARAAGARATSSRSGSSSSTSSCSRSDDGSIEIADAHDTLEKPCYDMAGLTRQYDFLTTVSQVLQRARLGQLRERPRGRERPVRAELHLRRRARQLRPRDLLPLHGAHARRAARA